jgi:hypothetical protein
VGEPLVVADDESHIGGLPAGSLVVKELVKLAVQEQAYEDLWWTFIAVAIENNSTDTLKMTGLLEGAQSLEAGAARIRAALRHDTRPRVFLVDGLETMFDQKHAKALIEALFRVASTLEHDPLFRARISLRIFLRTDITAWGFQNFEQQTYGKRLDLEWSTQTIFNFVLSRLPNLQWIRETFPKVVSDVRSLDNRIADGDVSEEECMRLLLRIFPKKVGRLNLNTATFLRTYFSDDPQGKESYYPRVYDTFLGSIDRAGVNGAKLVSGRIDQAVIVSAHDEASNAFLQQVRQELRFLIPLDDGGLNRLLNALNGERTPFNPRDLGGRLRISLKLKKTEVDNTLEAMKSIGIFEIHPSLPGYWRVGRLFKSALGMIYNRGGQL